MTRDKDVFNKAMAGDKAAIASLARKFNIPAKRTSIVLFKHHNTVEDYISSIVHEAEHVKDGILEYYNIPNRGEAPAYTIGYLVRVMFRVFKLLL